MDHPVYVMTKGMEEDHDQYTCMDCLVPIRDMPGFYIIGKRRGPSRSKIVCTLCAVKYKKQETDYRVYTESHVMRKDEFCMLCGNALKPDMFAVKVECDAETDSDCAYLCRHCYDNEIGDKPDEMRIYLRRYHHAPNKDWFNNGKCCECV